MKNQKESCYVYKHTTPNGKVYIGISGQKHLSGRWHNGEGYKRQYFYRAIKKYGWENIKHEILEEGLSVEDANKLEEFYIKKYKSDQKDYGYNVQPGGDTSSPSLETRRKISQSQIGRRYYPSTIYCYDLEGDLVNIFGSYKEASETLGIKLFSIANACNVGGIIKGYCFSKKSMHFEEVDARIRKSKNVKRIFCYSINTLELVSIFESRKEASELMGISQDTISVSCNWGIDKSKMCPKGYKFSYHQLNKNLLKAIKKYYLNVRFGNVCPECHATRGLHRKTCSKFIPRKVAHTTKCLECGVYGRHKKTCSQWAQPIYKHICRFCGNEYATTSQSSNYCNECMNTILKCYICGEKVIISQDKVREFLRSGSRPRVLCKNCSSKTSHKKIKNHTPSNKRATKQNKDKTYKLICKACGQAFISNSYKRKYCDKCTCPETICAGCGKKFILSVSQTKEYRMKNGIGDWYCSRKCFHSSERRLQKAKATSKNKYGVEFWAQDKRLAQKVWAKRRKNKT